MNEEGLKEERNHLKDVINKVKNAREGIVKSLEVISKDNIERLKELRDEGSSAFGSRSNDFDILLDQLHQKNLAFNIKGKYQTLDELEFLTSEPYFSRIDLYDPKTKNTSDYYIGKFSYTERKPIITDWRSKVASIYYRYRYPQQNVSYETPLGKEIKDLKLKRTYEIQEGSLIKYYNNDLQLDESTIISEKIKKRTGGILEDIIQTIQESQLDIIEADPRQVCIVQGCVGSGKSTVAIHKLAHIFFNFPKIIRPERCLMVTKSQILAGYLSTLFPKLGIFDVSYKTVREVAYNFIFRENINIKFNFDEGQDTGIYTLLKIKDMKKKIKSVQKNCESKITKVFSNPEYESFASFKYSYDETPYENAFYLLEDLTEEILNQKEQLKSNPDGVQSWLHKENISHLRKILKHINGIKNNIIHRDVKKVMKDLDIDVSKTLNYTEILVYLYVYSELVGLRNFKKYEYCVVDEAQDFSLLEYIFLDKCVLRGRFSLFGDLNQSLEEDGIKSWGEIPEVISDAKNAVEFKLSENYRSTKQIINFANKILRPYTAKYLPKSIDRVGEDPIEYIYDNNENMLKDFYEKIETELKIVEKSIGVIVFETEGLKTSQVEEMISKITINNGKDKIINLDPSEKISYDAKGVYLMSSKDCKGLEFSKVFILGLNLKKIKKFNDARNAFVAVTRAMNELQVYGVK